VSAKQILSISLLKDSSRIFYLGIYIGSYGSADIKNSGFLGSKIKSVPVLTPGSTGEVKFSDFFQKSLRRCI